MVKLTKTPKSNLQYRGPRTSSNRYWVLGTVNLYCKFEKQELSIIMKTCTTTAGRLFGTTVVRSHFSTKAIVLDVCSVHS
jgi:hypothetical protein